jgi:hypothetical protein
MKLAIAIFHGSKRSSPLILDALVLGRGRDAGITVNHARDCASGICIGKSQFHQGHADDADMPPPPKVPNADRRSREHLTPAEINRLIAAAQQLGRHGQRDATMILLAYRHGLRVSDPPAHAPPFDRLQAHQRRPGHLQQHSPVLSAVCDELENTVRGRG